MSHKHQGFSPKETATSLLQNVKINIKSKNEAQKAYWKLMDQKEIVLCSGPAGTGKSMMSIAKALNLLKKENNKYEKILLVTPAVDAGESIGFLPGDLEEKLFPYLFSSIYLIKKLVGPDTYQRLRAQEVIDIVGLGHVRGMNIDNTILLFEEAQNSTVEQMKNVLTRIGYNSKYIISGDVEQSDRYKEKDRQGLHYAMTRLEGMDEIGLHTFEQKDIVRNPLISKILDRFD